MVFVSKGSVEELFVMCEEQKVIHVMTRDRHRYGRAHMLRVKLLHLMCDFDKHITMFCVTGIDLVDRINGCI